MYTIRYHLKGQPQVETWGHEPMARAIAHLNVKVADNGNLRCYDAIGHVIVEYRNGCRVPNGWGCID